MPPGRAIRPDQKRPHRVEVVGESARDIPVPYKKDWYVIYRPGPKALAEIRATKNKRTKRREKLKDGAHSSGLRGGRHDAG